MRSILSLLLLVAATDARIFSWVESYASSTCAGNKLWDVALGNPSAEANTCTMISNDVTTFSRRRSSTPTLKYVKDTCSGTTAPISYGAIYTDSSCATLMAKGSESGVTIYYDPMSGAQTCESDTNEIRTGLYSRYTCKDIPDTQVIIATNYGDSTCTEANLLDYQTLFKDACMAWQEAGENTGDPVTQYSRLATLYTAGTHITYTVYPSVADCSGTGQPFLAATAMETCVSDGKDNYQKFHLLQAAPSTPVNTPTAAPTAVPVVPTSAPTSAPTTISQEVTFGDLTAFTGDTKLVYEAGFGTALSIYNSTTNVWKYGSSVTSSVSRRSVAVKFEATIPSANGGAAAATQANAVASLMVSTPSMMRYSIIAANAGLFSGGITSTNIPAPTDSSISAAAPVMSGGPTSTSASDDGGSNAGLIIGVVVGITVLLGGSFAAWKFTRPSSDKMAKGHSSALDTCAKV